ncbi:hypothetical protein [uncultured Nocardioides sp.]|uniref:hypothetical protein n=1 Tax=uncultured Nocardioides sp. TaxID=198441 RepID=UPI0026068640|nr:hypothetical protein [uncultured Nocardioides sp.]
MATASAAPRKPASSAPTAATASAARRRPRSGRLVGAVVLLVLATLVAVGAVVAVVVLDTATPWPVAAGLLVLALGAAATRSTHLELLLSRREAGAERARLAKEYRGITDERVAESTAFTASMRRRLDDAESTAAEHLATVHAHEAALDRRERRLAAIEAELDVTRDRLEGTELLAREQATRADSLESRLSAERASAAESLAEANTRINALEVERDGLRHELLLWRSEPGGRRRA